ncbi:hypothetical protein AAKU67_002664 [Oxalobacteraceae bacterium GrIS 2.11]
MMSPLAGVWIDTACRISGRPCVPGCRAISNTCSGFGWFVNLVIRNGPPNLFQATTIPSSLPGSIQILKKAEMKRSTKITLICISLASLSACGGGGGGGGAVSATPPVSTQTFDYHAANLKSYQAGQNVSFTVTQTGSVKCNGTASLIQTPFNTAATFNPTPSQSVSAFSATTTVTLNWTDCTPASQAISTTDYISASNSTPLGISQNGTFGVFSIAPVYPSSVTVGQSGSLGTIQQYTDSTESAGAGYQNFEYAVSAGTGSSSVTITGTQQEYDASNTLVVTETDVAQLSSSGTLTITSMTIVDAQSGNTIIMTAK